MIPERVQRLALAGLLHDLPALAAQAGHTLAGAGRVLALARLADPGDLALLRRAERCALALGDGYALDATGPLCSVFAHIAAGAVEAPLAWHALAPLPPAELWEDDLAAAVAPGPQPRGAYLESMFDALDRLAATVDLTHFAATHAHLLAWIDRYGASLPVHQGDIAFCDHARLTAAAAACLAHMPDPGTAEPFCLLAGTLVGAREYCLAAAHQHADLARLHGRSLYLRALREALGHALAERLELPYGNVVSWDAGRLYVLAPNTPATNAALVAFAAEIDLWLHGASAGALAFALARQDLGEAQFQPSARGQAGFGQVIEKLHAALERAIGRPGCGALIGGEGWREDAFVFRERSFARRAPCAACGRLPASQAARLCPECARDERLGGEALRARYLAFYNREVRDAAELMPGRAFRPLPASEVHALGQPYLVVKLDDSSIDELAALPGTFCYSAGRVPVGDDGATLRLADIARQAQGHALLGYVQLAIDGAGALPGRLRRDSAVHVLALQRELELFRAAGPRRLLATAGYAPFAALDLGDSVLLAGPWSQAAPLAIDLRASLGRRTGQHPGISCSAGVLFSRPGYPPARAAAAAAAGASMGDRLALLGETLPWPAAMGVLDEIARLHQHGQTLSAQLLRDLAEYGRLQRLWREEQRVEGLRYKAMFVYSISQALRRGDAEIYQWADELIQSLHGQSDSPAMRYLGPIATYLLLLRREE